MYTKENVFQQKLLGKTYFIFKLTGQAMVLPASSDKWKALLEAMRARGIIVLVNPTGWSKISRIKKFS